MVNMVWALSELKTLQIDIVELSLKYGLYPIDLMRKLMLRIVLI